MSVRLKDAMMIYPSWVAAVAVIDDVMDQGG
jgi:hypothetical protein